MWLTDTYDVRTASTGEEAIAKLTPNIKVVLLDRRMPAFPGEEVLNEIRNRGLDCRVAMVKAIKPDIDVIEMGFDDYLTKPITKTEVQHVVQQLSTLHYQDELFQEYFALASKITTLEAHVDMETLSSKEEYAELKERFNSIKREVRDQLTHLMTTDDTNRVFRRLMTDWPPQSEPSPTRAESGAGND